jgi:membrane protein YdbS with pleckstrin-like domain
MSGDRTASRSEGTRRFAAHLLPHEKVVAAERRHWAVLIIPIASPVLGLVVALWLDVRLPQNAPALHNLVWLAWLASLLWLGYKYVEWRTDWFVATNKRVILAYGVFTRRVAMMPLMKVTDMSYNRSVLGRAFGYGEFVLESAGQDQALRQVSYLPHPDELYAEICLEIFGAPAPPPPPAPGSPPGQYSDYGRFSGSGSVTTVVPRDPADD